MSIIKEIEINKKGSLGNILAAFVCDALLFVLISIYFNFLSSTLIVFALVFLYFFYYVVFYLFIGSTFGMRLFYLKFNKDKNIPGLFVYKSNIKIDEKGFNARKFSFFKSILAVILDILLAPLIIAVIAVLAFAIALVTAPVSLPIILVGFVLMPFVILGSFILPIFVPLFIYNQTFGMKILGIKTLKVDRCYHFLMYALVLPVFIYYFTNFVIRNFSF
jgi:hypothetical protein